ncbi:2'-5' RNA ligase family protein [Staphylococcus taiwanensis]|nr:2'-5' RNA ligase family protein [Staphylococcus taiwanensis]
MNIGLALIPSKSFQDEVNGYRKRYDTEYARIMPHITIKSHFEINDAELDSVKEEVKKRLEGFGPVEVHATKASSFKPTNNVIYFKVAKTDELEQLFDKFNTEDFHGEAEHPFVPHFTIAQGLSSQEFEDIYGQVELAGVDHKETIDELSLLSYDEDDDKWKVIDTFKLA